MHKVKRIQDYAFYKSLTGLAFVEQIVLYGSRAREDNQDRSDIDLAIACPEANGEQWQQVLKIIEEADTLLKIDLVRLESLSPNNPLRVSVLRDGQTLFDRKSA